MRFRTKADGGTRAAIALILMSQLNSYRHRTNDLLADSSNTNYEEMTGQPTI